MSRAPSGVLRRLSSLALRGAGGAAALGAFLFVPTCAGGGPSSAPAADASLLGVVPREGVTITAASWSLSWDLSGVTLEPGGGVSFENDLGYRVRIHEGYIVNHSVSLGACDPPTQTQEARSWPWPLGVRSALAHTEDTDPSWLELMVVEDLARPRTSATEVGSSAFAPGRYCRAHWLLARGKDGMAGPASVDLSHRSAWLRGSWERDGVAHRFAVDTWWPEGRLPDLEDVVSQAQLDEARGSGAPRYALVSVVRHLGLAFDGVDFETASDDVVTGMFIDDLVRTADLVVDLRAP